MLYNGAPAVDARGPRGPEDSARSPAGVAMILSNVFWPRRGCADPEEVLSNEEVPLVPLFEAL